MLKLNTKSKKPRQWKAYFAMTWYAFLAQTRNPASFAFGFIFPIVFISVFGLIGDQERTLTVGISETTEPNQVLTVLEQQKYMELQTGNAKTLKQQLKEGKLSGIIEIGDHKVTILSSTANPVEAQALASVMEGVIAKTNLRIAGIENPYLTLYQREITGRDFRYIDFALPGQIGFSLLSTSIFGTVFGLIYLKRSLILKRMFATPTKALTILIGQGTSRLIIALIQTLLILTIGVFVFNFHLPHGLTTFFDLMIISTIGLIAFLGFGYLIAGLSKDDNTAAPLVNIITLPQFLLSGTFFPIEDLPSWIQPVAGNLPLSYFNAAVRIITTEGGNLTETMPYLLGLAAWGIIMYLIATKTFKWE